MTFRVSAGWTVESLQRRLLLSLERARTRLAVAIARESKVTSPEKWRSYRETEDRLRRCLKELRAHRETVRVSADQWISALEVLDRLLLTPEPRHSPGEAQQLSMHISEVLIFLEAVGYGQRTGPQQS